tara:strand:+ start:359 stop:610 length:252 start_codon:yes stop_codon:yes gene_type:complete
MATKITRDSEQAKKAVSAILEAMNDQVDQGATPSDLVHALTFIICIYKFKFDWTTEQILKLYEEYILKMELSLVESPEPYGEA